jgi:alpha-glucosidase
MPQYFGKLPTTNQPWTGIGGVDGFEQCDRASAAKSDRNIIVKCGVSTIAIAILTANLIRVRLAPTGEFTSRRPWAVNLDDADFPQVSFAVRENDASIEIETELIRVSIQKHNSKITCFDKENRPFAEDAGIGMGWRKGAVAAWKRIETSEHFYGFGERTGLLDKLNEVKTNWTTDSLDYGSLTDEMYHAIPFFMALRPQLAYGIFFNTTFWSQFDIGAEQPGVWKMETRGGELDYYIIYGSQPSQILDTYSQLTGKMPMPPKWALGYHQCRWSYESETVVSQLAREFRTRRIPCDVIHLDIDYMDGYRVFTWSPKRFPNPEKLIGDLAKNGFKTVTIIDPGVKYEPEGDYSVFDEGLKNDYFVRQADGRLFHGYVWPDKSVFPDFLRKDVQQWWGDLHKSLTDIGIAGIWNDMNEPAINERPFGDGGVHIWFPLDAPQGNEGVGSREWVVRGDKGEVGQVKEENNISPSTSSIPYSLLPTPSTHAEVHNLYGLSMVKACASGLQRHRSDARSFVLTRSGFAGVQRYSSVWMGDNQSLWEHLEMSLPMLCNMGLSGVPFVGCDIGGFAGNATAELFARWMQVGMLYPLMRAHSAMTTVRHEPWAFGERVENICREYINLRYQLLPYIYTLFWEAATTGAPILRPLVYHYPHDAKTYQLYDQVLLGSSLMAAPIYRPGVEYRAVYLPEGTWFDWWTGEKYSGSTYILAHAPLERMPLYARAGAIIPMQPVMQYVDERSLDELRLRIFPGIGEYKLYEDDGHSFDYAKGIYATTNVRIFREGEKTVVEIAPSDGQLQLPLRQVVVELVGIGEQYFEDGGTHRVEFGMA